MKHSTKYKIKEILKNYWKPFKKFLIGLAWTIGISLVIVIDWVMCSILIIAPLGWAWWINIFITPAFFVIEFCICVFIRDTIDNWKEIDVPRDIAVLDEKPKKESGALSMVKKDKSCRGSIA